jgi:hypothetical protein
VLGQGVGGSCVTQLTGIRKSHKSGNGSNSPLMGRLWDPLRAACGIHCGRPVGSIAGSPWGLRRAARGVVISRPWSPFCRVRNERGSSPSMAVTLSGVAKWSCTPSARVAWSPSGVHVDTGGTSRAVSVVVREIVRGRECGDRFASEWLGWQGCDPEGRSGGAGGTRGMPVRAGSRVESSRGGRASGAREVDAVRSLGRACRGVMCLGVACSYHRDSGLEVLFPGRRTDVRPYQVIKNIPTVIRYRPWWTGGRHR